MNAQAENPRPEAFPPAIAIVMTPADREAVERYIDAVADHVVLAAQLCYGRRALVIPDLLTYAARLLDEVTTHVIMAAELTGTDPEAARPCHRGSNSPKGGA